MEGKDAICVHHIRICLGARWDYMGCSAVLTDLRKCFVVTHIKTFKKFFYIPIYTEMTSGACVCVNEGNTSMMERNLKDKSPPRMHDMRFYWAFITRRNDNENARQMIIYMYVRTECGTFFWSHK